MGQKKNKGLLITIIILLIVIILLAGVMAYLYFFTDMFKSNKQLFFKYTSQLVQTEKGFVDDNVLQYWQKKKNTSYENTGDISFNVTIPNLEESLELANHLNIHFSGKTDANNAKTEKEISVNYSDDVNFPLTYRRTNTMTGIQTKYIGSNFVAVRNDEELSGYEDLTKFTDLENIQFSNEEIQNLKTTYFDNILNNLDDSKFSKLTEGDLTGYKLTLTGEEFKNTLIQILNSLKTDENTLNKINNIIGVLNDSDKLDASTIENLIKSINDGLTINNNVEFTVYETGRNLTRVDITIEGNTATINKEGNEQEVSYTISLNSAEEDGNLTVTVKYAGLNTDNINENYEITLEGKQNTDSILAKSQDTQQGLQVNSERDTIKLLIANIVADKAANGEDYTQISDTDIEQKLSSGEEESYSDMKLEKESDTEYSITYISTGDKFVVSNAGEIIEEPGSTTIQENSNSNSQDNTIRYKYTITNNVQFKDRIDIEDLTEDNAVILNDKDDAYVTNLMNAIKERLEQVNKVQMEELGVSENENPIQYVIPTYLILGETTAEINEEEVNTFNAKFELYESTNTKGATVKGLLTTIQNNNEAEDNNKIEEINMDGEEYEVTEQNITFLKSNINVDDAYRVEFEKDSNTGLIYRAVINKR